MFGGKSTKKAVGGSTKKKAPPRPPPPRTNSIKADVPLYNHKLGRNQNTSCSYNISHRSDLIDLRTPPSSPPKSQVQQPNVTRGGVTCSSAAPDFKYHIGASIFYLKSELKGSTSNKATANPFSPPRPSPQSLLSSPAHSKAAAGSTTIATKYLSNPTIIKPHAQTTEGYSASSSDPWNNNNNASQSQYKNNVPLTWDEPPKKITHIPPTVIRPVPPPKKPGLGTARINKPIAPNPTSSVAANASSSWADTSPPPMVSTTNAFDSQPRYDDPPESEDEEDSFSSKPMPAEPPPPPPPELQFEEDYNNDDYPQVSGDPAYNTGDNYSDSDHAYGIALYDYNSQEPGDLQFQAGDVIYLTRRVDDSWLFGFCGSVEGMFPSNFVNVVVPLPDEEFYAPHGDLAQGANDQAYSEDYTTTTTGSTQEYYAQCYITVLHDFEGTEATDLTIRENEVVTILGQINEDWLYGELHGNRGQFPASFVSTVPAGLPVIDLNSV